LADAISRKERDFHGSKKEGQESNKEEGRSEKEEGHQEEEGLMPLRKEENPDVRIGIFRS